MINSGVVWIWASVIAKPWEFARCFDVFPLFVNANCARNQNVTFYEGVWTFCESPSAKS